MGAARGAAPPTGRPRARVAAVLVTGILLAAILGYVILTIGPSGSPHGSPGSPDGISLLPSDGTASACITGTPGVPRPSYALDYGTLQANTYDVPAGTTGHVGMCYDASSGSLFGYANWTHVGATGWFSYPQLAYGVADWLGAASTYTGQGAAWSLPQTVAQVVSENVWFTTTYNLRAPNASDVDGYDLSLDDFFTETLPPEFQVGPFVEVETFLAHNISYPFEWVHWSTETLVNGSVMFEPWDVGYWCHGVDNGTNANVSFDFSYDGQSTHGLPVGTLGVNVSAELGEVEALMPAVTCWSGPTNGFAAFHFDEANLGSEDGALGGTSFNYNWTVDEYCIRLGANLTHSPACVIQLATPADRGPPAGDALELELRGEPRP